MIMVDNHKKFETKRESQKLCSKTKQKAMQLSYDHLTAAKPTEKTHLIALSVSGPIMEWVKQIS